jgi:hypothetical protein
LATAANGCFQKLSPNGCFQKSIAWFRRREEGLAGYLLEKKHQAPSSCLIGFILKILLILSDFFSSRAANLSAAQAI